MLRSTTRGGSRSPARMRSETADVTRIAIAPSVPFARRDATHVIRVAPRAAAAAAAQSGSRDEQTQLRRAIAAEDRYVILTVVAATLALALPAADPVAPRAATAARRTDAAAPHGSDAMTMFAALNAQRVAHGLAPLALDSRLCAVATEHARDMAARNYFDHVTPDGRTPWDRLDAAGVRYGYAGENLAQDETPAAAERALWRSSGHRANIMEQHYVRVGISAVATPEGEVFVQEFSD